MGTTAPRHWQAAGLLAFLGSGLGYLYTGRPRAALAQCLVNASFLYALWTGLGGWLATAPVALGLIAMSLITVGYFIFDAIRTARRLSDYRLQWYNRTPIMLSVAGMGLLVGSLDAIPGTGVSKSVRSYHFPSASMEPTLRVGERGLVDMRAYIAREPERGDVTVYQRPRDNRSRYVARVIGLPGDEVQVAGGLLRINGQMVPTTDAGSYSLLVWELKGATHRTVTLKQETLPNGRQIQVLDEEARGMYDNTVVYKVPAGHYFMMGDNRDNSTDSRISHTVGFIPRANLIGRVSFIYWPSELSRFGWSVR